MRPLFVRDRARARLSHRDIPISLVTLALAAALSACGDSSTAPAAADQSPQLRESKAFTVNGTTYPSVTIQGANVQLAVGGQETLKAKLATPTATWMGAYMSYATSDPSVVSVSTSDWGSNSGDQASITGKKDGTATITATTLSGTSSSITINVGVGSTQQATGPYHEPAGMTQQINTGPISASPVGQFQAGSNTFTVWSPSTMSSVGEWAGNLTSIPGETGLRVLYQPSLAGGNSPVRWGASIPNSGSGHLYVRWKMRLSPNWTLSKAVGLKVMEPRTVNSTENHVISLGPYGQPTDGSNMWHSVFLQFAENGGTTSFGIPGNKYGQGDTPNYFTSPLGNIGGAARGSWHTMEVYFQPESPAGNGNGQLTLWVDGTQVFQTGGYGSPPGGTHFFLSGERMGWNYLMFDPTYGGDQATDHPPTTIYWDIDQLYVSTK